MRPSPIYSPLLDQGSDTMGQELATLYAMAESTRVEALEARQVVRCRAAYHGDLYGDTPMPSWKTPKVHPKVNEVVESYAAILTDQEPKFTPKKRHDENDKLAEAFFECSDYEWERQKMQTKMMVQARAILTDGSNFFYTGVEAHSKNNLYTKVLSPFSVTLDPYSDTDEDASFCAIDFSASESELAAAFPDVIDEILANTIPSGGRKNNDDETHRIGPPRSGFGHGRPHVGSLNGEPTEIVTPMHPAEHRFTDRYRVREWWFAKGSERELNLVLADGGNRSLKLPGNKGRRIITVEDRYFEKLDTDNPHDHGEIPVTRFNCVTLLGEAYGYPFIVPLLDLAEELADLDNMIRWNAKLMMNPIWFVPLQSGVNVKKLIGAPGLAIPYRHPFKPEPHIPPPLPQYVFEHRRNKQQEFDTTAGLADINRGQFRGGLDDVSGKAVSMLSKPAYRRMQPVQRSIEEGLPRWGRQSLCNAAQYWPTERWLQVLDEDTAHQEMMQPGSILPWLAPGHNKPVDGYLPDIRMAVGSNLPVDKAEKSSVVMNAYDRGALGVAGEPESAQLLLEGIGFPDVEKAVEAVAITKTRQMQMQGLAPAGGAPPAAPTPQDGQDKALGGERSPESDLAVMADPNGQEVPA